MGGLQCPPARPRGTPARPPAGRPTVHRLRLPIRKRVLSRFPSRGSPPTSGQRTWGGGGVSGRCGVPLPVQNNKDYFDQSLDEIKLLKYVNEHDPSDEFGILRLYDYFYYKVGVIASACQDVPSVHRRGESRSSRRRLGASSPPQDKQGLCVRKELRSSGLEETKSMSRAAPTLSRACHVSHASP
jgi:hypothetical protein